jgi:hypothetical protein
MFKTFAFSTAIIVTLAAPAFASQCTDDIAKIDAAMVKTELDADVKTELMNLREQAVQLCGAGNDQEGLDSTAQAKVLLNIE